MIRRVNGYWVLFCDGCSNYREFERSLMFRDVILEAKKEGWRIHRSPEGDWEHFCPCCTESSLSGGNKQ